MIKNYLKVALRAIRRDTLSSFINIFGLALAMMCSILIYLFIQDELSYDKYHRHADRIYRVTRNFLSPDGSVNLHLGHLAPPFGPLLKNDFSEFETVVRTLNSRLLVSSEEKGEERKSFNEERVYFAEPGIFDVFSISVLEGNEDKALDQPFNVMLSAKTAKKYFGSEHALGKSLKIAKTYNAVVSGVFEDFPAQSHLHPEILVSFSTLNDSTVYGRRGLETNWGNNSFGTYILARAPLDKQKIESQFPDFVDRHMRRQEASNNDPLPSSWTNLFLQKVTDIHLHSHLDSEEEANGNINNVYMMGVIGVFIVLIACFNFVNLSTARASKRSKEVGLRKVVGALKTQLINQYLSESVLIAMFALVASVGFSVMAVGWLNEFTDKSIDLNPADNVSLWVGVLIFAIVVGLLAGIYPSFVLSGFKPALILKGQQGSAKGKGMLRRILVVAQFSISIVLIVATLITLKQLRYLNDRELGYTKDQVITLRYFGDLASNYDAFFNELVKQSSIENIARSSRTPTGRLLDSQGAGRIQKGDSLSDTNVVLKNIRIDQEFFNTYEIDFAAGRNFSKDIKTDDSLAFILNESAVKMMGMTSEEIVDKEFQYAGVKGRVIGVVKDFHFESLHEPIVPIVFEPGKNFNNISIKLAGDNLQAGLAHVESTWRELLPDRPFEFEFLSAKYQRLYNSEQRQGQLFIIFASLAILIACLGLFGLATFNAMQRVKEIGIRKVLGASVPSILTLLSREIVVLMVVANLIAWPVAWYFMDMWLGTFAYHINMDILAYLMAGGAAVVIALVTVSSQTIKAATSNPANTLRYE